MGNTWVDTVEYHCRRYGPGRLPGANRPAIGAGYAFATAAFLATLAWHIIVSGVTLGIVGVFLSVYVPFVLSAFVLGWAGWKRVPGGPGQGAIAGSLVTALSYLFGSMFNFMRAWSSGYDGGLIEIISYFFYYSIAGGYFWFVHIVSIGAVAGYIYGRVQAENSQYNQKYNKDDTLEDDCQRYGPGRLPGANRPAIGAGYAFATAAFLATSVWILLLDGGSIAVSDFLKYILFLSPFVLSAFVGGWAVWKTLVPSSPRQGAIAGLVVPALSYLATFLISILGGSALGGFLVFIATFWLTLPIGAVAGYIYGVQAENSQ